MASKRSAENCENEHPETHAKKAAGVFFELHNFITEVCHSYNECIYLYHSKPGVGNTYHSLTVKKYDSPSQWLESHHLDVNMVSPHPKMKNASHSVKNQVLYLWVCAFFFPVTRAWLDHGLGVSFGYPGTLVTKWSTLTSHFGSREDPLCCCVLFGSVGRLT